MKPAGIPSKIGLALVLAAALALVLTLQAPEFLAARAQPAVSKPPLPTGPGLRADITVYFVDRVTGRRQPIANFPVLRASFGPSCNEYTIGPGEKPPTDLAPFCAWRTQLLKQKKDLKTNASGKATLSLKAPALPKIKQDVFAKYFPFAQEVMPGFDYYGSARQAGWDYQKFDIKVKSKRANKTTWRTDVTLTGFVGDRPD